MLSQDKGSAASSAALLGVSIGEKRALLGDAVDIRRVLTHDAKVIRADIVNADVIAPDDENVRLLRLRKKVVR